MEKRPLIGGSLCVVVLLVIGSLSNVVGYQSVKSTVSDSPLFATRTQRAINQQQNILTPQYLGMKNRILLQFPMRDNRTEQLKKAIDIISNMDDITFMWFTKLCIQKARQNDTQQDLSDYQIIQALHLFKTSPEAIINFYTIRNNHEDPPTFITYCGTYTLCGAATPGCLIVNIILLFIMIPIWIFLDLLTIGSYRCENPSRINI